MLHSKFLKGFTLVEMTVVMVIIAFLAGFTVLNVGPILSQARNVRRLDDLKRLKVLLIQYNARYGGYPDTATWATDLKNVSNVFPLKDQQGKPYGYASCGGLAPGFVLSTTMERGVPDKEQLAPEQGDIDGVACNVTCDDPVYCVTE